MVQQWNNNGVTVELYGIIIQLLWGHNGTLGVHYGTLMGSEWKSYGHTMELLCGHHVTVIGPLWSSMGSP